MTQPEPEWVTIAEAARLLSIAPRQARRYAERIGDGDRQAAQGEEPLRVRLSAVAELRRQTEAKKAEDTPGTQAGTSGGDTAEDSPRDTPQDMTLISRAYEMVLREKDARISELAAALEHEREMSRRLAEALAREQTLRALTAPEPEAEEKAEPAEEPRPWWRWQKRPGRPPSDPPS